jgi:NitT/TauT family transport system permease protein
VRDFVVGFVMASLEQTDSDLLNPGRVMKFGRAPWPSSRWVLTRVVPALAFCVLLVAAWQIMALKTASPLIPGVSEIAEEMKRIVITGIATKQIGITLWRILRGFSLAFVIACGLGIVAARSVVVRAFLEPAIVLGLTVPGLVWALLCVIWFGVSPWTAIVSIALGITPALMLNIIQGVRSVDPQIIEMAHVFRLPQRTRLLRIWLPSLTPYLFSGMRLGLSLAWKVIVLVELFGLSNGVGYQLDSEFSSQNVAGVIAWTVVFWIVMSFIEYGLIQTLEYRSRRWQRTARV